ncbi:MAG TPA: hypothetical protein VMH50_00805 [Thermoleophilia bacterium]|nr:hypothetical protein [Thermoleophilia bacterium]
MVRPLALLSLVLGVLLAACGSAFAAGAGAATPSATSVPARPPDVVILERTAVDPQGDVWVTGRTVDSGARLVEYYEGGTWQALPAPPARTAGAILPFSTNDVWLAGGSRFAHWDGSVWTVTPHPRVAGLDVRDIAGAATNDVWVVGRRNGIALRVPGDGPGERTRFQRAVTLHWDGHVWSVVRAPELPGVDQGLDGVAVGGGQVWAVGEIQHLLNADAVGEPNVEPLLRYAPLALQWKDGAWRRVRHQDYGNGGTYLVDVSVLPDGTPWTVGVVRVSANIVSGKDATWWTLVERRRGAHWLIRQEKVTKWRVLPWAIAATSGHDVWVACMDDRGWPAAEYWNALGWELFPVEELGWTPGAGMVGTGVPDVAADADGTWLLGGYTLLADAADTVGDQLIWRHDAAGWTKIAFARK